MSIEGTAKRTYNDKGQVVSAQSDQTDVNGNRRVSDYQRTEARNENGELEVTEKSSIPEDPKNGPRRTLEQEQVTAQTDKGPHLLRASQTITGPEGTARASISPKGQELTVNGKRIDTLGELRELPTEQASLGATAQDGLSEQVRDFNELSKGLEQEDPKQRKFDRSEERAAASANSYGLFRLKQALTTANSQATGTPDPSAGASNFLGDIHDRNYAAAARDDTNAALGGGSIYSGSKALITSLKGSGTGLTLGGALSTGGGRINPSIAGEIAGKAAVGLGVLSGGAQAYNGLKEGNGWQVASGAVTAGAAVGGYLAAGAAAGAWGGPAGAAVGLGVGLAAYGVTKPRKGVREFERHHVARQLA